MDEAEYEVMREDGGLVRSRANLLVLLRKGGMALIGEMRQPDLPPDLMPITMYAVQPAAWVQRASRGAAVP